MNPIDPTRLRRSQRATANRLGIAWGAAAGFLLLVLIGLLLAKYGV
jgi:hypothetical protein